MTVRVERVFDIAAPPEAVWGFIVDPEKRVRPLSVVDEFEQTSETTAIWHVKLPIPRLDRTVAVETEDVERDEPNHVTFTGRSKAMNVQGEHVLEETNGGTRLTNRFVVEGRLPGVETYFKRTFDGELSSLEDAIREELEG